MMRRMKRSTSTNPSLTQTVMRLLVMARFKTEKQKCEEIGWQADWFIVFYVHLYKMHESDEFIAEEGLRLASLFAYC
jgi:hypothetical protein